MIYVLDECVPKTRHGNMRIVRAHRAARRHFDVPRNAGRQSLFQSIRSLKCGAPGPFPAPKLSSLYRKHGLTT